MNSISFFRQNSPNFFWIIFSTFFLWKSLKIPNPGYDSLGPGFLPSIVLIGIIIFASCSIIQNLINNLSLKNHITSSSEEETIITNGSTEYNPYKPLFVILILSSFIWALNEQIMRFEILAGLFMFCSGIVLSGISKTYILINIILSLSMPLIIGFIFKSFFFANLP